MTEPHFSTPPGFKEEYFRISRTTIDIIVHEVDKLKNNAIVCPDTDASYIRICSLIMELKRI